MAWHATAPNPGKCSSKYGREGPFPSPVNPRSYVYRSKLPDPQPSRLGASVVPKNATYTAPATMPAFDFSSGHLQALPALLCTSSLSTGPNLPATREHARTNPLTSTVEPQSRFPPLAPSPMGEAHREHGCLPRTPVARSPCLVRVSLHSVYSNIVGSPPSPPCTVHPRLPYTACAAARSYDTAAPRPCAVTSACGALVRVCTSPAAIRTPTPGADPLVRRTRIACPHSEARAEAGPNLVRLRRRFPASTRSRLSRLGPGNGPSPPSNAPRRPTDRLRRTSRGTVTVHWHWQGRRGWRVRTTRPEEPSAVFFVCLPFRLLRPFGRSRFPLCTNC